MASTITQGLDPSAPATSILANSLEAPLARLAAFEPTAFPVLSVYLDTQPDQHGRAPDALPFLHREFKSLARTWAPNSPERHSFDQDTERIVAWVADEIDPAAHGVAIFACHGTDKFFEAIQLTAPVRVNRVSAGEQPHLYDLLHLDEHFPRYAAVLTDMNTARIFVFGLGAVVGEEAVKGTKVHQVKVGGWSQARYQRRAANAHHKHAREVMEHLARIVREEKIHHVILAGDQTVIPLLQAEMPPEMVGMTQVMTLDTHASERDILAATLRELQSLEVTTSAEKANRLLHEYRARNLAVAGPEETLAALAKGQVDELLISGGLEGDAIRTADGGAVADAAGEVPLADQLVAKAIQTDATVTFIEDAALLESVGGVGAFLRWHE